MTTMAAAPGTDMAVATVIPAVGATHTPLAAVSEWAGRSGGQHPPSREAILLGSTAVPVAGRLAVVAVVAAGLIEGSLEADTEKGLGNHEVNGLKPSCSVIQSVQRTSVIQEDFSFLKTAFYGPLSFKSEQSSNVSLFLLCLNGISLSFFLPISHSMVLLPI